MLNTHAKKCQPKAVGHRKRKQALSASTRVPASTLDVCDYRRVWRPSTRVAHVSSARLSYAQDMHERVGIDSTIDILNWQSRILATVTTTETMHNRTGTSSSSTLSLISSSLRLCTQHRCCDAAAIVPCAYELVITFRPLSSIAAL